jgi:antitoxin (DNA-binding transcriptional repressor) of toxin-antitoxin stability system
MKTVNFTEFRKNASSFFSDVENGSVLVVIRHGKPIAEVSPVSPLQASPAWKQPALRLSVNGAGLASAIIADRSDEDIL